MGAMARQGQGTGTVLKERGFGAAFAVSLGISMTPKVARFPYWHIDLNSGSGWNDKSVCEGSPIVFLRESERRKNTRIFFCDKDEQSIERLAVHPLVMERRAQCLPWDNREVLPVVEILIARVERPEKAIGTVVVDPNGYMGDAFPHEQLIDFARRHPRIDVVMNLNVRTYRMGKAHVRKGNPGWANKFWPSIASFPEIFSRSHWLISEVRSFGGDQFVILVGRNMPTGAHESLRLFHMKSPMGEEIIDGIESVKAEKAASSLFALSELSGVPAAPDVPRRARTGDEAHELALRFVRRSGDGDSPLEAGGQQVLPLGPV